MLGKTLSRGKPSQDNSSFQQYSLRHFTLDISQTFPPHQVNFPDLRPSSNNNLSSSNFDQAADSAAAAPSNLRRLRSPKRGHKMQRFLHQNFDFLFLLLLSPTYTLFCLFLPLHTFSLDAVNIYYMLFCHHEI